MSSKTVRKDAAFIMIFSSEMEAHLSLHVARRMSPIIIKRIKKSISVKEEWRSGRFAFFNSVVEWKSAYPGRSF
jgi:hypothetical protein